LNTTVTRILTDGTCGRQNDVKVVGVSATFSDGTSSTDFNYMANKGVILAAGTFKTPQLLMVSGIGDSNLLSSLGIPVKVDLKGVGKNLKDHYGVPLLFIAKQFSPINNQTFLAQQVAQYAQNGTGYLALPSFNHALISVASDGNVHHKPDVALVTGPLSFFPDPHELVVFSILVAPYSTGTVKISSNSIYDKPLIDYGYFSDNRDWIAINNSFQVTRTILGQSSFSDWFNFEAFPLGLPDVVVKSTVVTAEHPMGTCMMGKRSDDMAVVDSDGSVFGTSGLYISDASVIPTTNGATPDASILATVILLTRIIANGLLCDFAGVCN
jgi:choline dehydrogenase-like flavoprotein